MQTTLTRDQATAQHTPGQTVAIWWDDEYLGSGIIIRASGPGHWSVRGENGRSMGLPAEWLKPVARAQA